MMGGFSSAMPHAAGCPITSRSIPATRSTTAPIGLAGSVAAPFMTEFAEFEASHEYRPAL